MSLAHWIADKLARPASHPPLSIGQVTLVNHRFTLGNGDFILGWPWKPPFLPCVNELGEVYETVICICSPSRAP